MTNHLRPDEESRYVHTPKTRPFPMFKAAAEKRPCTRCGLSVWKKTDPLCRDCRESDPEYLAAIRQGERCA